VRHSTQARRVPARIRGQTCDGRRREPSQRRPAVSGHALPRRLKVVRDVHEQREGARAPSRYNCAYFPGFGLWVCPGGTPGAELEHAPPSLWPVHLSPLGAVHASALGAAAPMSTAAPRARDTSRFFMAAFLFAYGRPAPPCLRNGTYPPRAAEKRAQAVDRRASHSLVARYVVRNDSGGSTLFSPAWPGERTCVA